MTKQKLEQIHSELMQLGEEVFSEHDQEGILVLGPVIGWLHSKIRDYPPEVPDGGTGA